jgi:hypothetical protein
LLFGESTLSATFAGAGVAFSFAGLPSQPGQHAAALVAVWETDAAPFVPIGPVVVVNPPAAPATPLPAGEAPRRTAAGYWLLAENGAVYPFGDAPHLDGTTAPAGASGAVDIERTPSGLGYWILSQSGHVQGHGDAHDLGNADRSMFLPREEPVSLSATPSGRGYWIFTDRGRVIAHGDAQPYGDMIGTPLNAPVLDSVATPSGLGYFMVAADGGIFAFGDAVFAGSMGGRPLNAPVQSLVPDADGTGYWLVAADGGVFAFAAPFRGSMGGTPLNQPISGMVRYGDGYLMVARDGGVFVFSDRPFSGSLGASPPSAAVVAITSQP